MAAVLATMMGGARSFPAVFPQILLHVTPAHLRAADDDPIDF